MDYAKTNVRVPLFANPKYGAQIPLVSNRKCLNVRRLWTLDAGPRFPMITATNLTLRAGEFVLHDVSFAIEQGEYVVLMGRTGCGKTTLLEAICGLKPVEEGTIHLDGRDVTHAKPAARGIGYVPQDLAIFSAMPVAKQIGFALHIRKWPQDDIDHRVHELAELLGIKHLLDRTPQGLSGGEQQRVALGRALSFRPRVLCLDEPLSALDADTRDSMYHLLKTVHEHEGVTALHVTHNQDEADRLASRVFRVENGAVREVNVNTAPRMPSHE